MVSAAAWSSTRAQLLVCTPFRARPPTQCRGWPSGVGSGGSRPPSGPRLGPSPRTTRTQARRRGRTGAGRPRARAGAAASRTHAQHAGHAARAEHVDHLAAFPAARRCELRPGSRARGRLRNDGPGPDPQHPALCGRQPPEWGPPHPLKAGGRETGTQSPWCGDDGGRVRAQPFRAAGCRRRPSRTPHANDGHRGDAARAALISHAAFSQQPLPTA